MSSHLKDLNPPQREAVTTLSGPLLVLAGAGTGKTRVVTCRIGEILSKGIAPEAICSVTFTNKAAREMRERAGKLLPRHDLSGMVISTFHSLGLRILRDFGPKVGFKKHANIADESDQLSILTDALRESGVSRSALRPQDARWRISGFKNAGLLPDVVIENADHGLDGALAVAYERYEEELERRGLFDFDDLILKPLRVFKEADSVLTTLRNRWHYLMVDEYQDTNGCQYQIIKDLAGPRANLCVVGDDDQSIYAWRGADPARILRFTKDFPKAKVVTLDQNYRSTSKILHAANTLIVGNRERREKKLWSALGDGEPVTLYRAEDEKDEVDFVASQILSTRRSTNLPWRDVAVLFRANSQCRPLEQALRARQIPYRVVGTKSFFDRREVRDILCFLRLIRNENDDSAFLRIINVPARGIGKGSIDRVIQWASELRLGLLPAMIARHTELPPKASEAAIVFSSLLRSVSELAASKGVGAALEHLVQETQYKAHLGMVVDDPLELESRITVVNELIESAQAHNRRGEDSLDTYLDALALRDDERSESKDDSDAVTLLTMHAAKGLEFPLVFLVGLEEGILPHANSLQGADSEGVPDDRGIDVRAARTVAANTEARYTLAPDEVTALSAGAELAAFPSDHEDPIGGESSFVVEVAGRFDGFVGWFEAALSPTVTITNDPWADDRIDRWCNFYPVDDAVDVRPGDRVAVRLDVRPRLGVVSWSIDLEPSGGERRRFRHSTFQGSFLTAETVDSFARGTPVPHSDRLDAVREVLDLVDGVRTQAAIVDALSDRIGTTFVSSAEVEAFVRDVASFAR
jgi:superfamily I DNA/RNA helicase